MTLDKRISILEQKNAVNEEKHNNIEKVWISIKDLLEKQGVEHAMDRKEFMKIQKKQDETMLVLGIGQQEQEKKIDNMQSTLDKENTNNSIKYQEYDKKHKEYDGLMNKAIGWSAGISFGGVGILGAVAKTLGWIH